MWFLRGFLSLIGRLMLCAIFVMGTVGAIVDSSRPVKPGSDATNFDQYVEALRAKEVPQPKLVLISSAVVLVLGSLMVVLGFKSRVGAFLLLLSLGFMTFYLHDFWNRDTHDFGEILHFMKNLSLAGALVYLIGNGGGAWALDGRDNMTDEDYL